MKQVKVKVSTVWFVLAMVFCAFVVFSVVLATPMLIANDRKACAQTDNPDMCLKGRGWKGGGMNAPLDQG